MQLKIVVDSCILLLNRRGYANDSFGRILVQICVNIQLFVAHFCRLVDRPVACLTFLCFNIKVFVD